MFAGAPNTFPRKETVMANKTEAQRLYETLQGVIADRIEDRKRIAALEAALRRYGIHTLACASLRSERCDCGWTAALCSNFAQETPVVTLCDCVALCRESNSAWKCPPGQTCKLTTQSKTEGK
jgi:hypothetical protein